MPDQAPTFERPKTLAEKLPDIFTYHSPKGDQPKMYAAIREKALELAQVIISCTPRPQIRQRRSGCSAKL